MSRKETFELALNNALVALAENGRGIVKASQDGDASRIRTKIGAFQQSFEDAENAFHSLISVWAIEDAQEFFANEKELTKT